MIRLITFSPGDEAHARYFMACWQAVLAGGDPRRQDAGYVGRKAIKQGRRIKDALRTVARATMRTDGAEGKKDTLELDPAGGTITLSEDDFGRLVELVEKTAWVGAALEDADDTFDFLDASPKKTHKEVTALLAGVEASAEAE